MLVQVVTLLEVVIRSLFVELWSYCQELIKEKTNVVHNLVRTIYRTVLVDVFTMNFFFFLRRVPVGTVVSN